MFRLIALFLCLAPPALAREVTDDAGHLVTLPDRPERVVSLHDWTLTVMLHELGVPMAGSTYRMGPDGVPFLRGAGDLFGLGEADVPLASIHGQIDAERIAALRPDLIIGTIGDASALRDQLAGIAPVLLFDAATDEDPMARYRRLAGWLGAEPRFEHLLQALPGPPSQAAACRWVLVNAAPGDGTLTVARRYGALDPAAARMGWQPDGAVQMVPKGADRAVLSPEIAGAIVPDVLVTTFLETRGETAASARAGFDEVAPGYLDFLEGRGTRIIALPREYFYPTSFRGIAAAMQAFAAMDTTGCD